MTDPSAHRTSAPARPRRSTLRPVALAAALVLAIAGWGASTPLASADAAFTFQGSGWGHGVGMSQWGARGMAAQGSSAAQILSHYYTGTSLGAVATPGIRVLLGTASSFTLTPTAPSAYSVLGGAGLGSSAGVVTATASGGAVLLSGGVNTVAGGAVAVSAAGSPMRVSPPGYRYNRGTIVLIPTGTGTLQAVLSISMQEYLYGLGEMPSSWPAAALEAQATAARTYAQKKVNTVGGGGTYDIVGGLPDQSYIGWDKEGASMGNLWTAAVDATNALVVLSNGGLIDAVYSASSGGHTESSESVWVSALPYLRGVPDPADLTGGNPNASWVRTYTGSQLGAWFGLGEVTSVQVLGPLGVSGRVDKSVVRLIGTAGSLDLLGSSFRSTVNASSPSAQLMSTRFSVNGAPAPPATPSTLPTGWIAVAKADGRTIVVAGRVGDAEGAPRVRIVSVMGAQVAVRETQSVNGDWMAVWSGTPGTRSICMSAIDVPTGQTVSIGCRDVTVK